MSQINATLNVIPKLPIKGLYYIAQYGTSGYAAAAKGYMYYYFVSGLPITWEPLYFDNSRLSVDDIYDVVAQSLINKPISHYDMVIMHCTPDLWSVQWRDNTKVLQNKIVNGYCTWETNILPELWVKNINERVHEVWCPSTYNEKSFRESGVIIPIRVVPHIFLPQELPVRDHIRLKDFVTNAKIDSNGPYTFYCIGELMARKGIDDLIKAFCTAFDKSSPVRLILKVHYKDYSPGNIRKCESMLQDLLKKYPNHPTIICLTQNMTSKEILALHSIGDCYVSLTKSEGFGLTIFDAFNYGRKVIATGYSGHIDFLGKNYGGLVSYELGAVKGMDQFSSLYTQNQLWAYPNIDHAVQLMRKAANI